MGGAATLGNKLRAFKTAERRYAALLERNPNAGPELRATLRAQAEQGPGNVPFYEGTLSAQKSVTVLWVACGRAAILARAGAAAAREVGDLARAGELNAQAASRGGRATSVEQVMLIGHRAGLGYLAGASMTVWTTPRLSVGWWPASWHRWPSTSAP